MNENTYINTFQNKTDAELESLLKNKEKYNDQAILASAQILKNRNGQSLELETIINEIEAIKEKKMVTQKKAIEEQEKKNNTVEDTNVPELHSKLLILIFTVLFSTIFGVVLLMYNMKQINNQKARVQVLIFGIVYTITSLIIVDLLNSKENIAIIFNILGGAILTEYFWNTYIGKEFKYRKRSWMKPVLISFLITIPLLLVVLYGQ